MTSESFIYDPAHWRTRADEARILAKELDDSESRAAMLRMAQDYERLAQWVEDRALRGLLQRTKTQNTSGATWTSIPCWCL
jgi:hypothetical protein